MIENLVLKHQSGLCLSKIRNETLYYQQNYDLEPPSFIIKRISPKIGSSSNMNILLKEDCIVMIITTSNYLQTE